MKADRKAKRPGPEQIFTSEPPGPFAESLRWGEKIFNFGRRGIEQKHTLPPPSPF